MFEYAILPGDWRNNFYIFRQDGTLLFERDSTVATWAVGSYSGSYDVRPIINTPLGAKMFLAKADSLGFQNAVDVYSLCGVLPEFDFIISPSLESYVKIYPNPSNNQIHFDFNQKNKLINFELVIYNSFGQMVINYDNMAGSMKDYFFDTSQFQAGTYLFTINSGNKIIQRGKFIISK